MHVLLQWPTVKRTDALLPHVISAEIWKVSPRLLSFQ